MLIPFLTVGFTHTHKRSSLDHLITAVGQPKNAVAFAVGSFVLFCSEKGNLLSQAVASN